MKIVFTGGGTGGHIFPIIAVAREIRHTPNLRDAELYFVGPEDKLYFDLLDQEGIKIKNIWAGKLRRYLGIKSFFQNIVDIFIRIPVGLFQAFWYLFFAAPDLIFSKGGFGSFPVVLASWLLQIPILLHESDIIPGIANRFLSMFAMGTFISFPHTEFLRPSKKIVVGNPIRRELLISSKKEAIEALRLEGNKPIILVLGGSQGAQRINDRVLDVFPGLLERFEVIHQVGMGNVKQVKAEAAVVVAKVLEKYYHVYPFFKEAELKHAYQAADLVISRAGSGSIFEIAAFGKPSILIPLPESAQDHQIKNAYAYSHYGACKVLEEVNFTARFFSETLRNLFARPEELERLSTAALRFSKPRAAQIVAEYISEFLKK
jgi:UDP-N-acetylglucosamine--N-acetylmuramyl-(pentapeptide) pyrophosphoryl-undecaprenol N-acetylglucosamine transferase